MPAWTKIFSKKGGRSIIREKQQTGEDEAIPHFMQGTRKGCPEEAKSGRVIRFLYVKVEVEVELTLILRLRLICGWG